MPKLDLHSKEGAADMKDPLSKPSAARMKRARQRKQAGAACTNPRPVAREVIDALIAADLLQEADRGDRDAVTEAVHRACGAALAPVIADAQPGPTAQRAARNGTIRVQLDVAANAVEALVLAGVLEEGRRDDRGAVASAVITATNVALGPIFENLAQLQAAEERRRAGEERRRVEAEEAAARKRAEEAELAARERARESNPELREYSRKYEQEFLKWERSRDFRPAPVLY